MTDRVAFEGFPRERFLERRARVLDVLGGGAMVLPAAPILHRNGDAELRYRPDSELFYLTGFTEPGALLLLRGFADEDRSVLFVRPRDESAERWTGTRLGPEAAAGRIGVDDARSIEDPAEDLPGLLAGADRVHFRLGRSTEVDALVTRALVTARSKGKVDGTGPRGVMDPGEILDEMRLRKDADEIEALREATRITVAGIREGISVVRPGAGEWEVEAAVDGSFRRAGAREPAFPTIVGSGPNACTLHYVENARRMEAGELVLIDAGAERRMYAGDATRTVAVSGAFSPEQTAVYEIVDEARRRAVEAATPGATLDGVHRAALATLVAGLIEIGVLEGEPDALIEEKAYRPFFPHKTSHWLGLDTHDVGDYARDGEPRPLEPGMVLTVEPGLYFPGRAREGDGESGESPFSGIGIRIEDDVLVTDGGPEVLTGGLPTSPDELAEVAGSGAGGKGSAA